MTERRARAAYVRPDLAMNNPRGLEYDLLARATAALRSAEKDGDAGFPALVEALNSNLRLWTSFAADVAGANNGLPPELRAKLFYLYEFTAHHSRAVLERRGAASVLVAINTAVMRGLRGEAAT